MTEREAKEMLEKLTKHYKQPVMPISKYCEAISTWMTVMQNKARAKEEKAGRPRDEWGPLAKLHLVRMSIMKSNLLWRMLYRGEALRTIACPVHGGRQATGLLCLRQENYFDENGDIKARGNECGCGGTGWLPNEEE